MAPKRKGDKAEKSTAKKARPTSCPKVASVPKLLVKGGIEVLNVVTGDDAITHIELYLNPRMGSNSTSGKWYTYSYDIEPTSAVMAVENLPAYSVAKVNLPMLNEDLTCDTLQMWEAVSVKTEIVGVNSLFNCHYFDGKRVHDQGAVISTSGTNYHMFAVGGEPLDLQGIVLDASTKYPSGDGKPINIQTVTGKAMTFANQGLDPTARTKLTQDGLFPIEIWGPDPSRNENSRYFGSFQSGGMTPTVLQFTNTLTTVLLDENGVGPLCKGDGLFVSAADVCGFLFKTSGKMAFHGLPRYFDITLRKRWVKNPYPVTNLLNSLFNNMMPKITGQPMSGTKSQVEEVRIYQGMEKIPGDPNVPRYIDQFGNQRTGIPSNTNVTPVVPPAALIPESPSETPEDTESTPSPPSSPRPGTLPTSRPSVIALPPPSTNPDLPDIPPQGFPPMPAYIPPRAYQNTASGYTPFVCKKKMATNDVQK
ncbi:minor capsid protein VP1 [Rhinolophus sinicus polyomavirus 1]|nr:minor capsid protein VP1 [Rhinolophus sinicus polyomavirus 1]